MSTITFTCYACNQVLKVGADKAGKKAKCVKCGTILTIPVAAGEAEVVSPEPPPAPRGGPPPRPPSRGTPPPASRRRDFEFEEDAPAPRRPRREEEYEEAPPPPRRPRREDDYDDAPAPRRPRRDEYEDDYDAAPRRRSRDDDYDDYDRRPGRKWGDWGKVQLGFMLNGIAGGLLIGYAGVMVLALLLFLIGINAMSEGMVRTFLIMVGIGGIINFALQVVAVIAFVFCMFAPAKNGAMALAITCLALAAISLILKIVYVLIPSFSYFSLRGGFAGLVGISGGPVVTSVAAAILLQIFFTLLYHAEYIVCSIFIRQVGRCRKDRYLMSGGIMSLVMACIAVGLQILFIILSVAMSGSPGRGTFTVLMIMGMLGYGMLAAFASVYMRVNLQARNTAAS